MHDAHKSYQVSIRSELQTSSLVFARSRAERNMSEREAWWKRGKEH